MRHCAIVVHGLEISENGFKTLTESSKKVKNDFEVEKFEATTQEFAQVTLRGAGLKWTYPWQGEKIDFASGLTLRAYATQVQERRIACFMSHYRLWHQCYDKNEPILVLEHDAQFVKKLDYDYILESKYSIIGLNNPLMATRKARQYHEMILEKPQEIQPIPVIDEQQVPQGLAGNSAYIIKPEGAKSLIDAANQYGAWPNDALMCRQLIPNMGVTREFYTKVQGLQSTTTS